MNSKIRTRKCIFRVPGRLFRARALAVFWMVIGFTQVNGQSLIDEAGALKELGGLYIMGGDVEEELLSHGLDKEQVFARVTSRISMGGMRVLNEMEWLMIESAPVLFIDIRSENSVYVVRLEILYLVHPVSNPSATSYAVIWSDYRAGRIEEDSAEAVLRDLDLLAAILANDYNTNQ